MSATLSEVLAVIAEPERRSASYRISVVRPDALMVEIAVLGERWEVEFQASDDIEVERFRSPGNIDGADSFSDLWELLQENSSCVDR
ncbi:hypothetical protein MNBD_ACTINO02-1319 [hydrothermal vent metagenome]|uniref:Uncharacterized protein n=1 Tax=hydrothermal vent metagenome TaxID=652676 RepID=A0A3B0RWZ1_9ZZZZ